MKSSIHLEIVKMVITIIYIIFNLKLPFVDMENKIRLEVNEIKLDELRILIDVLKVFLSKIIFFKYF